MGFIFFTAIAVLCWIFYLILKRTKAINPSTDGTMLDISPTDDRTSKNSVFFNEEVEETQVEKLQKVEISEVEVEKEGRKEENGVDYIVEEQNENDEDFLSYDEEVSKDEFDIRVAEILIKANEMDIAQESICDKFSEDKSEQLEKHEVECKERSEVECSAQNIVSEIDAAVDKHEWECRGGSEVESSSQNNDISEVNVKSTEINEEAEVEKWVGEDLKEKILIEDKDELKSKESKEDSFLQILKDLQGAESLKGINEAIRVLEDDEEVWETSEESEGKIITDISQENEREIKSHRDISPECSVTKEIREKIMKDENVTKEIKEIQVETNTKEIKEIMEDKIVTREIREEIIKDNNVTSEIRKDSKMDRNTEEIMEDKIVTKETKEEIMEDTKEIRKDNQVEINTEEMEDKNVTKEIRKDTKVEINMEEIGEEIIEDKIVTKEIREEIMEDKNVEHEFSEENKQKSQIINKKVTITHEDDYIQNYNEEIQISEVIETEQLLHQQKIEYTEIAGEEEVLYRNVTKYGGEEFVEEFKTKNEIFNEKSCTSSVVTNEEICSQQTSSKTVTKVINLSYTTEECSTENIEIMTIIGDKGAFKPLLDNEQYKKIDLEPIKEIITVSKTGTFDENVTDGIMKENVTTFESVNVENVSNDGVKEMKKPVGGVYLFGGEELLNKIKSRKLIVDSYEKEENKQFDNGDEWRLSEVNRGINECQVTSKTASASTASSSTTTMTTQKRNQTTQMKQDIREINLTSKAFDKTDAQPLLSANVCQPTNNEDSTAHFSESPFEDDFIMTSHNGSEGEIISEIPTFETESPLIHLNKDRNKGPIRRRKPEKSKEEL